MPVPRLALDEILLQRPSGTADAEGEYVTGTTTISTIFGTYGQASDRDLQQASQRGQIVDATVAMDSMYDVRVGDILTMRSHTWTVVTVDDLRIHQRLRVRQLR